MHLKLILELILWLGAVHQLRSELSGMLDPRVKLSQAARKATLGLEQTAIVYKTLEKVLLRMARQGATCADG